jgi:predicted membrane channel-forming protein YqfA (hemolysin III family)
MKPYCRTILLSSGMLAVVIYLLHILIGGILWRTYNHLQQPISDLTATGAPNRFLLLLFTNIYGGLALIFAVSFTLFEGKKRHKIVFWGGISFIILHVVSISYSFFPQDSPGAEPSFAGMMHLAVTVLIVPFTILTPLLIGFGLKKEKAWETLGNFSLICGILIIILGGMSGFFFAKGLPYFGLVERINIGTLQIWTFVLSYKLSTSKYEGH